MNIQALRFVLDIDGDGTIAGWEVMDALKWGFTLPGRLLAEGLGHIPFIADTFNIQASAATGYASFHGLLASGSSLLFWVFILYILTCIGTRGDSDTTATDSPMTSDRCHYRGPRPRKHLN